MEFIEKEEYSFEAVDNAVAFCLTNEDLLCLTNEDLVNIGCLIARLHMQPNSLNENGDNQFMKMIFKAENLKTLGLTRMGAHNLIEVRIVVSKNIELHFNVPFFSYVTFIYLFSSVIIFTPLRYSSDLVYGILLFIVTLDLVFCNGGSRGKDNAFYKSVERRNIGFV